MQWPLVPKPIPPQQVPFYNLHYLHGCRRPADPTIVWGTDLPAQPLLDYVCERNRTSRTIISIAHVLVQAVGRALRRHSELNRRVVGKRIYDFRDVNVRMMTYDRRCGEVDVLLLRDVDTMSLERISRLMWKHQQRAAVGQSMDRRDEAWLRRKFPGPLLGWVLRTYLWLDNHFPLPKVDRIDRTACSPVLVNYLAFSGAPPMRGYKPSSFPHESSTLSVTLGRSEWRPVVRSGSVVADQVAPLFVRADHRIANAYLLGQFTETLRQLLAHPAGMDQQHEALEAGSALGASADGRQGVNE